MASAYFLPPLPDLGNSRAVRLFSSILHRQNVVPYLSVIAPVETRLPPATVLLNSPVPPTKFWTVTLSFKPANAQRITLLKGLSFNERPAKVTIDWLSLSSQILLTFLASLSDGIHCHGTTLAKVVLPRRRTERLGAPLKNLAKSLLAVGLAKSCRAVF